MKINKRVIIGVIISYAIISASILVLSYKSIHSQKDINKLTKRVEVLANTVHSLIDHIDLIQRELDVQIYKKDAQLYLMNVAYGNPIMHREMADSCKNDCLKYKLKYNLK